MTAAVIVLVVVLTGCATAARHVDRANPGGAMNAGVSAAATGSFVGVAVWGGARLIDGISTFIKSRPQAADEP